MLSSFSTINSIAKFKPSTAVVPTQSWGSAFTGSIYASQAGYYAFATLTQTIGTSAFTIEFWMYTNTNAVCGIFGLSAYDSNSTTNGRLTCFYNFPGITGRLMIQTSYNANLMIVSNSIPQGQWVHVAIVRDSSNVVKVYVNGVASTYTATSNTFPSATWNYNFNNGRISLFRDYYDLNQEYFTSRLTGFAISKSAWYSSNFTPNTNKLNNDSSKILLLNPASGSVLTDSSSSANTFTNTSLTFDTGHP